MLQMVSVVICALLIIGGAVGFYLSHRHLAPRHRKPMVEYGTESCADLASWTGGGSSSDAHSGSDGDGGE